MINRVIEIIIDRLINTENSGIVSCSPKWNRTKQTTIIQSRGVTEESRTKQNRTKNSTGQMKIKQKTTEYYAI